MATAITNKLNITFNYSAIDSKFDIFMISTSGKYILKGSAVLDIPEINLRVCSVAFDFGRSAFALFDKKDNVTSGMLVKALHAEDISITKKSSQDLKDFILFRLFLFSLNCSSNPELSFNNLTGRFYAFLPAWISKNGKSFKALDIDIDKDCNLQANATTFVSTTLIHNKKELGSMPRYTFSYTNHSLKRVFSDDNKDAFIRKTLGDKKTEIPFLELSPRKIKNNKAYIIYQTIDALKSKFSDLMSFDFEKRTIADTIKDPRDKDFAKIVQADLRFQQINCVNLDHDSGDQMFFDSLVQQLQLMVSPSAVSIGEDINPDSLNILFIHNKDFYATNSYLDPYKNLNRNNVIQCVTCEDVGEFLLDKTPAIFNTLLKELVIKKDILKTKKITMDDWESFDFKDNVIFGIEKDNIQYFMRIHPDGCFEFESKKDDFTPFKDVELNKLSEILSESDKQTKCIISDADKNTVLFSRMNQYVLPDPAIFEAASIRSKAGRAAYLSGVTDICLYPMNDGVTCYSVGLIGQGMNSSIPKATLFYRSEVIRGKDITNQLLKTMSSVFVKYGEFTVLPYPIKYLREFSEIVNPIISEKSKEAHLSH
jgi:hypothetical protein